MDINYFLIILLGYFANINLFRKIFVIFPVLYII